MSMFHGVSRSRSRPRAFTVSPYLNLSLLGMSRFESRKTNHFCRFRGAQPLLCGRWHSRVSFAAAAASRRRHPGLLAADERCAAPWGNWSTRFLPRTSPGVRGLQPILVGRAGGLERRAHGAHGVVSLQCLASKRPATRFADASASLPALVVGYFLAIATYDFTTSPRAPLVLPAFFSACSTMR